MTETSGTYDVARCHCDADWRIEQWVSADVLIVCKQCGEVIMDFETVARWNKQRAEIERLRADVVMWEVAAEGNWPFEWEVATVQREEIKRLRAELAESQRLTEGYAEAVVDYEQQVHELRALVAEYDSRRGLNLTNLATLQTELRAATQENERLQNLLAAGGLGWALKRWDEECGEQGISLAALLIEVHGYTNALRWSKAWKAAAKYERAEATAFEAALTAAEERAEAAERKLEQERKLAELRSRPYRQSDGTQKTDGTTRSR